MPRILLIRALVAASAILLSWGLCKPARRLMATVKALRARSKPVAQPRPELFDK